MYEALSKSQKEAVDYFEGNSLIVAGAGSGKTRVLVEKIKKVINILKPGEKVLAITFSNKAADELKERLEKTIDREDLEKRIFVGTIHNFCSEIINTRGNLIGIPNNLHIFESYDDRLKIFNEAVDNVPEFKNKYISEKFSIRENFDLLSKAKRNLKFYTDYEKDSPASLVFKEYDELLISQGAIDFDDILRYTYKLFNEMESITKFYQRIYKYIFVDEAQDLNKAQYEIIRLLSGDNNITTMVGDPNQSIYGFNGSSSEFFLNNYKNDLKPKLFKLKENFRSSKEIVKAAKKLESSFTVDGVCHYKGEFDIKEFNDENLEANWIFSKLMELLAEGHPDVEGQKIELEQCAVIARNRYVFNSLIDVLNKNNIDYTLKVSMNNSFSCESTLMKIFEYGVRLIINPIDKIHLRYLNELLSFNNISFDEILNYNYSSHLINTIKLGMPIIINSWKNLIKTQENDLNIKKVLDIVDIEFNKLDLIDDNEKNLVSCDIDMINNLWRIYITKSNVNNRSLANFIRSISLGETQIAYDKGLTLSTVHMSKGLEYDVVFIMGLNDGIFPDYRSFNNGKQLLEEKHNMFVSITRSKRLCYLTYPLTKNTKYGLKYQKASRFIKELKDI